MKVAWEKGKIVIIGLLLVGLQLNVAADETLGSVAVGRVIVHSGGVVISGPRGAREVSVSDDILADESVQAKEKTVAFLVVGVHTYRLEAMKAVIISELAERHKVQPKANRFALLARWVLVPQKKLSQPLSHKGGTEGEKDTLKILSPKGETKVLDTRPTLIWNRGHSTHRVRVYEAGEKLVWESLVRGGDYVEVSSENAASEAWPKI